VYTRVISAGKRVEFVSEVTAYIILRSRWYDITILNAHPSTEDKIIDGKDSFYYELAHVFNKYLEYFLHILLGKCNANVDREENFKQTIGNKILLEKNNGNVVGVVNFVTSKNLTVKRTMFQHCYIHKFTLAYRDGRTHIQIDHIIVDRLGIQVY
jgi:hypothetical protein